MYSDQFKPSRQKKKEGTITVKVSYKYDRLYCRDSRLSKGEFTVELTVLYLSHPAKSREEKTNQ